jgi:acetyl-CoA acetyltransferase
VGVGFTEFSSNSGVSTLSLAARAIKNALVDAGLSVADVDGLATFAVGDSVGPAQLAPALGLNDVSYYVNHRGGGSISHAIIGEAAMAVATGIATTVVCYRALNSRSEVRMSSAGRGRGNESMEEQYKNPYGWVMPVQAYAMAARQHMVKYGTKSEHWGAISVNQRAFAVKNDRATLRKPITLDDYLASRWIAEPFRLFDCCLESDGACAIVITSAERARDLRAKPVKIAAAGWALGHSLMSNQWSDQTESAATFLAKRLYTMAGIGPDEIDVAELYDCFTHSVLMQLEDYGFCPKGEGGPFAASGAIGLGGKIPTNTHGGFLSEAYIHGMNTLCEAVLQLRGECGDRQVLGAEVALSTGQPGVITGQTAGVLLRT